MKTKFHYLMICLSAIFAITFVSCSKDDDDAPGGGNSKLIVGTWRSDDSLGDNYEEYTFTADGKVKRVNSYYSSYDDGSWLLDIGTYSGTYLLSGDELVINLNKLEWKEKMFDYYDFEGNSHNNMILSENTGSRPRSESYSRTFVTITDKAFMWKYKFVTESGDVMTRTESFTKKK